MRERLHEMLMPIYKFGVQLPLRCCHFRRNSSTSPTESEVDIGEF